MGRKSPRFGNESCLRILLPLCIVFMANVRKDAYLRSRYTAGGDKEGSLWINRKKSGGVVEKCPEISYTKKIVSAISEYPGQRMERDIHESEDGRM